MKQKNNKKKNGFEKIKFIIFVLLMGMSSCLYAQTDNKTVVSPTTEKTSVHHNKFSSFSESTLKRTLKVAVYEAAPFAFFSKKSNVWEGISVAVWERIARVNNISFKYIQVTKEEGEKGVAQGKYDLMLGSFAAFPEDGMQFDYTVPFYVAGMGLAVQEMEGMKFLTFFKQFFTWNVFKILMGLSCFVLIGAVSIQFLERKDNPAFQDGFWKGLGNGIWWSSATVSTVGYGAIMPNSFWGRTVGIIWMFLAVLLISSIMGSISSTLTIGQLSPFLHNLKDLKSMKVACVNDTASKAYLSENFIPYHLVENLKVGLKAVEQGQVEAFVSSEPILRYAALTNQINGITIMRTGNLNQYYSFILSMRSDLLHPLNQDILRLINSSEFKEILYTYLGNIAEVH